ncbi:MULTISPECIES: TetR/AcrR family transcriptional regulator [unclassified Acidovorax]|uniref:TetR/AcrR family transcriptional regulator n=1 Tax=unclassified Acidovorax TaxID=2684926 RepID=UPI0009EC68D4|nr:MULTISPECIES: TetR/AcrR family transcriptional regulator [unclassified Acidovorax]PUA97332.1 TetR family transcriptional regulator [Acidovorax sp. 107]
MSSATFAPLPPGDRSAGADTGPASVAPTTRPNSALPARSRRAATAAGEVGDVRARILDTASRLFYERGVRAVGVDLVVLEAAVAKTSLYRYFPTKDDLIVAFLEREDVDFWATWDGVAAQFREDPAGELDAHMVWIGERLARSNYRGCPQINVAAEFAEQDHPARLVSQRHMQALRQRLRAIAVRLDAADPDRLAAQLAVLVNGAFVSAGLLSAEEGTGVLRAALKALLASAQAKG